jgi:hypothetical protein
MVYGDRSGRRGQPARPSPHYGRDGWTVKRPMRVETKARRVVTLLTLMAFIALTAGLGAGCSLFGGGKTGQDKPPVFEGFTLTDPGALTDPVAQAWVSICSLVSGIHTVSFDGETTYILAARGQKPTAGYTVFLSNVVRGPTGVGLTFKTADPSGAAADVISYPAALYRTQTPPGEIVAVTCEGTEILLWPQQGPANAAIIPTSPLPWVTISTTTLRLEGYARVFEAQFRYNLEDGHNVLAEGAVMADQGPPAWGRFGLDVEFARPTSPGLTLRLYDISPKDGSVTNEVFISLVWTGQ